MPYYHDRTTANSPFRVVVDCRHDKCNLKCELIFIAMNKFEGKYQNLNKNDQEWFLIRFGMNRPGHVIDTDPNYAPEAFLIQKISNCPHFFNTFNIMELIYNTKTGRIEKDGDEIDKTKYVDNPERFLPASRRIPDVYAIFQY